MLQGILFTCHIQFILQFCILSKTGVIFNPFAISVLFYNLSNSILLLLSYYFISASVTFLAYLALMVQFSQPYNKAGRASVPYNFTLVYFNIFCGLNTMLIMPVIFKQLLNMLSMSTSFS